ncbi:MAG: choice-of-anchor B family protein [Planctomycetes bacterium]|nr:choice-of-anchor B family protein [Planctomycetota bacterium]
MRIHSSILVVTGLVATLSAQGVNCALLGTFNNHGSFNDVWGYTAPNGDEYALLGAQTGTVVVDVTNPANPVERGWLPWGSSIWRDIRTYGTYAYVVTEATAGFQIIDLSNPNSPTSVGIFGTANSNNAHNVCIDTGTGRLYLVGCNTGTPVYDLTGNPANPTFLGFATGAGNSNYFHDLCVENGYAYGSMIYNGVLRIANAAGSLPWGSLSNTGTPNNFTHNAWPNAAGTVCVTTDEVGGGVVKFFDITNKSNPIARGQFTPNPVSTPHNAFIVGDKCHVSWYTEGYRCIDISDPNNPVEVASYDTYPGASGGYGGCWGCYPFLPSGNILASDQTAGLFIVKPTLAAFSNYGQGCPGSVPAPASCASVNPGGGTLSNNTNQYEYTFTVPSIGSAQVTGFDIFTRSNSGSALTVPAYIYAQAGSGPATTPLASTTMTLGTTAGFYSASFAAPVTVNGTFYVGFSGPNNTIICNLTAGAGGNGYYRTPVTGSWTASSLIARPSYVIYCTGGPQFATPALGNNGLPIVNSSYSVTLSDAVASSAAFLLTGLSDTAYQGTTLPAPIPGAPGCNVLAAPDANRLVITSASGTASSSLSVPNAGSLVGLRLYHQWAVLDAVNPVGIVVSDAGVGTVDY